MAQIVGAGRAAVGDRARPDDVTAIARTLAAQVGASSTSEASFPSLASPMQPLHPEGYMASNEMHLPHDHRVAGVVLGAVVILAAIIIFLMVMLTHNVGAY